jgi:hypothetical protein
MDLDKINNWENMSVSGIIGIMVKWLDFHHIELTTQARPKVESGVWYDIQVKDENFNYKFSVSAQRQDLLRARLIEQLDKLNLREEYLKAKNQ